ncbi:MAG: sterol carrier family protein [Corynebacterium sp.]|nr:sterol carrier family protein [Corynebacterium sp.]
MTKQVDVHDLMAAVGAVRTDITAGDTPPRAELSAAVRTSARYFAQLAPGHSVEVRIPPFVAIQAIAGPRHTRGTPPNVVETTPVEWLRLVLGLADLAASVEAGVTSSSGHLAGEVGRYLPLVK